MPLYQDEQKIATADFGQGRSLKITLKASAFSVEIAKRFHALQLQIESIQKQIGYLRERQNAEGITIEEFDRLAAQIQDWDNKPDQYDNIVRFIYAVADSWDNYQNKAAEERGEPLPITIEQIKLIDPTRLGPVFDAIGRALGIVADDEKKIPKTSSENLPEPSTQVERANTDSQTGTSNSATSLPLPNDSASVS